ncbi:MAG: hypothetical protein U0414_12285 [Polyangiaceae bacterium]
MFRELQSVTQHADADGHRRWFRDGAWDLIVWYDADRAIRGFQLCHDLAGVEHAATWHRGARLVHQRVDAGEDLPQNRTPVLVPGNVQVPTGLLAAFLARAGAIDGEIVVVVTRELA